MSAPPADDDPDDRPAYCVVWLYRDSPDAFERAARFALLNVGYGLEVVIVVTELGARLLQIDRMAHLLRIPGLPELIERLVDEGVALELDIGAARRAGLVETLGMGLPNLRVADEQRVAELATRARLTARY